MLTARDCMSTDLVTLHPETDLVEAVVKLLAHEISGAPVVDDAGQYLGVFSEKSALAAIMDAAYEQLSDHYVGAFTDDKAQTIEPDTHLLTIAQIFVLGPYRRLPVLEGGKLVGMVCRRDVLRTALDMLREESTEESEANLLALAALVERQ
jgi:CBS domain-containing protein